MFIPKDVMNSMELLAITAFIITVWLGVFMSQSQVRVIIGVSM